MQLIHRTTLEAGNTGSNADMKYGDMTQVPWWRQAEDDNFPTASAIIAELFRRDKRGFIMDRKSEDKLVLTCRFTSILTVSILKAKGIACRVRSGYAPYFPDTGGYSVDHWINEYWNEKEKRWVVIDVDGCLHDTGFDMFDIPVHAFDYPGKAWLDVRSGKVAGKHFLNAEPAVGIKVIGWALIYDFHSLMNNEIIYLHNVRYLHYKWNRLSESDKKSLDHLAELLCNPDKNFEQLQKIWNHEKKFRILSGGLLGAGK